MTEVSRPPEYASTTLLTFLLAVAWHLRLRLRLALPLRMGLATSGPRSEPLKAHLLEAKDPATRHSQT